MTPETLRDAAADLAEARLRVRANAGLDGPIKPQTLDEAYVLQDRLNEDLSAAGLGEATGLKIGCTTKVMQDYLGIPHPCAGMMFGSTIHQGEGAFDRSSLCRPGVECELAVELSSDITDLPEETPEAVAPFVGDVRASIELVDDRWVDFRRVDTPTLVADNFFNAGCVVGEPASVDPLTFDRLQGSMTINGERVGGGTGADILGHPLKALAWLARHRIERGRPPRAGQLVTLGSMVQTVWIDKGDRVEVAVSGLAPCGLRLL